MPLPEQPPVPAIGGRIRQVRGDRALTLDRLARLSGVSKSMLSQIERGQTNPTFATLWNLTRSLGIGIEELFDEPAAAGAGDDGAELLGAHFTPTIKSPDGLCTLRILSPLELASRIEWYDLEIAPGGALRSAAHGPGTVEHLSLLSGRLTIESGRRVIDAGAGETARYPVDREHAISNLHQQPAQAFLVVTSRVPADK